MARGITVSDTMHEQEGRAGEMTPGQPSSTWSRWLGALERWIAVGTECVAACLLLLEILLLFCGVASRYVLHHPLVWGEELSGTLFIWMAVLGAVVALRRGEHMRLTVIVSGMRAGWQQWCEALGLLAILLFTLEILLPALDYTNEQMIVTQPVLGISDAWRVAAIPVGLMLMAALAVLRVLRTAAVRELLLAALFLACLAGGLWFAQQSLVDLGTLNLLVFFVGLLAIGIVAGVPLAFVFGLATVAYLQTVTDFPLSIIISRMDEGMSSNLLLAIPLFIFLGNLLVATGMAQALIAFLASLLGHFRGGLSYVLIAAMYVVSGISGAKAADMAAVAPVLFPEMKRQGADPGELVALLAASGAMAETIPPSIVLIMISAVTGVSTAALFTGGLLPAVVGAAALCIIVFIHARKGGHVTQRRPPLRVIGKHLLTAAPALVLPFVIRTAVVEGIATATEVATVGVAYTLIVGTLFYRGMAWPRLYPMLVETIALSGAILFIVGIASAMAWALIQSGMAEGLSALMTDLPGGVATFLALSIAIFIALGTLLEGIPVILVFGPLLFPIARHLGVNEVHYAIIVILAMGLGLFAPPFGVGYYYACAISKVAPDAAFRKIWPYLGALLAAVVVIAAVPWITTGFLS